MLTLTAKPAGDHAVIFYLPEPVGDHYPRILQGLAERLPKEGIIDYVTAYHSLLVIFDPASHHQAELTDWMQQQLVEVTRQHFTSDNQRVVRIPVCYDDEFAIDIKDVAEHNQLTVEQVIAKHTETTYPVRCLGFIPGFAFLGYVDDSIATPRRSQPRAKVLSGSVGIGGRQTGVYPIDSPGGWQIIGRTPKTLYAPQKGIFSCFEMGDAVQFYAITADEFANWEEK